MMPIRTALRIMPAAWFVLPVAMFSGWFATLLHSPEGYGTAATAAASGTIPFVGAFVGGAAAWEGARLRRSGVWGGPWVRGDARIAAGAMAGPIAAGLLAILVAVVVSLIRVGASTPDLEIVGVLALDIFTYACLGFALGVLVPSALSVPLAVLLPFIWLAFVPAMYPVWLRHLTGMYRDCCGIAESLAPRALVASVAVDLGVVVAATVAVRVRLPGRPRLLSALAVLTAASVVGVSAASGMTYAPVVARDPSLLTCSTNNAVRLCLWPEHRDQADLLTTAIGDVVTSWKAAGIDSPTSVTEAWDSQPTGTLSVRLPDHLSKDGVIFAMATGMLPPAPNCGVATTGGIAFAYLEAWYAAAGGISSDSLERLDFPGDDANPSVLVAVNDLLAAPVSVRHSWVARAISLSQSCDESTAPDLRVAR